MVTIRNFSNQQTFLFCLGPIWPPPATAASGEPRRIPRGLLQALAILLAAPVRARGRRRDRSPRPVFNIVWGSLTPPPKPSPTFFWHNTRHNTKTHGKLLAHPWAVLLHSAHSEVSGLWVYLAKHGRQCSGGGKITFTPLPPGGGSDGS